MVEWFDPSRHKSVGGTHGHKIDEFRGLERISVGMGVNTPV